jgi:hypothetical protein|tara:strand:+ start:282 stop:545 length:264 start_codon:yes stop_codon:yes gene_type:complete
LPECFSTHASLESFDGIKAKSGSNLDHDELVNIVLGCELVFMLIENLVVSEPYPAVEKLEGEYVIDEGLALRMIFRGREAVAKNLFG